jgi:hypothetical protein
MSKLSKEVLNSIGTRRLFDTLRANAPKTIEHPIPKDQTPELSVRANDQPIGPIPQLVSFTWFHLIEGKGEEVKHSGIVKSWKSQKAYTIVSYLDQKEYLVFVENVQIIEKLFSSNRYPKANRTISTQDIANRIVLSQKRTERTTDLPPPPKSNRLIEFLTKKRKL